jgi:4-hydroxy-tetrahydrodipicolinate synthase
VHLNRLGDAGINVLVANEGSGESFTFSDAEMARVLEIAKEELQGKVTVRGMGRMVRKASDMIDFVRLVEEVGLDGVQIYALDMGHGLTPSVAEQERYLRDVLEHTHIPTVLSLHRLAGYSYPVELLDRIINDHPNIVGAIMTTNDVLYLWQVLEALGERIEVHTHTWNAMTNLALGGDGFAAPEANLAPRLCASVMEHYAAGRHGEAEAAFLKVMRLWTICGKYGSARGTKAALDILGLPAGPVRLPRLSVSDAERADIARALDELGVRETEAID